MTSRLSDLRIGALKSTSSRKPRVQSLASLDLPTQQTVESQALSTIPELQIIQQIPGSLPFLIIDLIPDLIFMLQFEGSKAFLDTLPKSENGDIQKEKLEPKPDNEFLRILMEQTWDAFLMTLWPYTQYQPEELISRIYNYGVQVMAQNIQQANPQNPSSIIFTNSSQNVHVKTQEIEIDIIRNEPEVSERDDIKCACGSRKIRTVPVQVRRADEPPTIFAQCVSCKLRWTFSSA